MLPEASFGLIEGLKLFEIDDHTQTNTTRYNLHITRKRHAFNGNYFMTKFGKVIIFHKT